LSSHTSSIRCRWAQCPVSVRVAYTGLNGGWWQMECRSPEPKGVSGP
jgi:hypothetical protein